MDDCAGLFARNRLRLLQDNGGLVGGKKYCAWDRREFKFERIARLPVDGGGNASPNIGIQCLGVGEGLHNGSDDVSTCSRSSALLERHGAYSFKRSISDEFRHVLCNEIVEVNVGWGEIDEEEGNQTRLYTVLGLGGVIRIKDIPKIPEHFDDNVENFYGLDTEDNSLGMPHFFQFAARDEVIIASSWTVLVAWLCRHSPYDLSGNGHVIWGTNIEYELGNIIKHWEAKEESLDVRWSKANLTKYDIIVNKKHQDWMLNTDLNMRLKIWDTLNHWKKSVKELGKILTESIKYDFSKLKFDPYALRYSAMDAIISRSYAAVQRDYYNKKKLKLLFTPGATALCAYTNASDDAGTKFCKHRLYHTHEEHELHWLIGALRGGRTEVFSLGEYTDKVGYYDINSAYPYAMKLGAFPNIAWHRWLKGHNAIADLIKGKVEGVVDCDVFADKLKGFPAHIPYLGMIDPVNSRFVFPLGTWRAKYTFYEIRKALLLGYRFTYHEACYYSVCNEQPFKEYVEFCYAIRDEGTAKKDPMLRDIGKSLGNNLFGKFGQRMQTSQLLNASTADPKDIEDAIIIDNCAIIKVDEGFARHTNVVWSAYITAMCRDLLYNHMMKAWANGNEILYCDTDSIFITGGTPPESHQTNLGALKHEGDLSYFRAYLPKVYVYEMDSSQRQYKAKGVPYSERERFIVQGLAEYKKPMKVREAMRRKEFKTSEPIELGIPAINAWIDVSKELKGDYTKRRVLEEGKTEALWMSAKETSKV